MDFIFAVFIYLLIVHFPIHISKKTVSFISGKVCKLQSDTEKFLTVFYVLIMWSNPFLSYYIFHVNILNSSYFWLKLGVTFIVILGALAVGVIISGIVAFSNYVVESLFFLDVNRLMQNSRYRELIPFDCGLNNYKQKFMIRFLLFLCKVFAPLSIVYFE